ncbi:MAG: lipopolysaccharide biosynthesis protein [Gemmatimonadetes bacterium]|nr:lipopolysaccharide biosynthesis protein [Gemmatimonadota bacterium]
MKDRDRHFRTLDLQDDLIGRSVRGGTVALGAQGTRVLLTVVSTIVLARILAPHDFGMVAMVTATTGFLGILRDLGLATATVQSEEIDQGQVSTLFWVNVITGALLAVAVILVSPAIAAFFREPRLVAIGIALGVLGLVESFGTQHEGLLRRRMRFGALSFAEVGSLAVGVVTGIVLALRGHGYWALVAMRFGTELTRISLLWILCDWRPDRTIHFGRVRSLLAFGGYLTLSQFVRYTARHVDRLLVGRAFGAEILGFYGRARGWLYAPAHLISGPVSRVAVPVLSRLRSEPERFRAWFGKGQEILASIALPLAAFLFADTRSVVLLILGDQWLPAIPIFRLLAPVAFAAVVHAGFQWCYISLGRADRQFRWSVFEMIVTITAFVVGMRWGVNGIAAAWSSVAILLAVPGALYCFHGSPIRTMDLVKSFFAPVTGSIAAAAAVRVFLAMRTIDNTILAVAVHAALFLFVYLLIWIGLPGGRERAKFFFGLAGRIRRPAPN